MRTSPLTQVLCALTSFHIVSMAKARLCLRYFEKLFEIKTPEEEYPDNPLWPWSATCAQGFDEDEDADLADELLVGFEEGVPRSQFQS